MTKFKNLFLTLILSTSLFSCMSFSDRSMRPLKNSITQELPGLTLKKEFAVSIGSSMFNLLDFVSVGTADISKIDDVDVAVYEISSLPYGDETLTQAALESALTAMDANLSWETVVKVNEDGEQVWVIVGLDSRTNTLEAVTVVTLETDSLVLVNVSGKFNELIEFAMQPARGHRGVVKT